MRPRPLLLALVALLLVPLAATGQDGADSRPGIAVMRFDNAGSHGDAAEAENFEALEVGLQDMLISELSQNSELRLVERGALQELLREQELGAQGRIEAETAARIGRLIGARYMILGSFVDVFEQVRMDARVVDVETGELLRARGVQDRREQIYGIVVELAQAITEGLELPELPQAVREARREREIPAEAVTLYSRALVFQDAGRTDEARELLQRVTTDFPQFVEAREKLQQLPTG